MPPHLPTIENLEVAASYRSLAEEAEVGGDFYDLFLLDDDEWGIVIGDVCGKGAEAAVLTALARYTLRAAAAHSRRPSAVLEELNLAMLRHAETATNGECPIDKVSAPCTSGYSWRGVPAGCGSARHPPPLVVRATDHSLPRVEGRFSGCSPLSTSSTKTSSSGGDGLMIYNDGVTELAARTGLSAERLAGPLRKRRRIGGRWVRLLRSGHQLMRRRCARVAHKRLRLPPL